MKKSKFNILIFLLTVLICDGTFASGQSIKSKRSTHSTAKTSIIQTVSYCDLLSNPRRYNKKIIRIKTIYLAGSEAATLDDPQCYQVRTLWVDFAPSYETCTPKKMQGEFHKILGPSSETLTDGGILMGRHRTAKVTFLGKFEVAHGFDWKKKDLAFNRGFGHLNSYPYRLIVTCLKHVEKAN